MDRECNKCIHHSSGACSSWDCDMQTIESYRAKVIDEFAGLLKERIYDCRCVDAKFAYVDEHDIDEIAEQMKGGVTWKD